MHPPSYAHGLAHPSPKKPPLLLLLLRATTPIRRRQMVTSQAICLTHTPQLPGILAGVAQALCRSLKASSKCPLTPTRAADSGDCSRSCAEESYRRRRGGDKLRAAAGYSSTALVKARCAAAMVGGGAAGAARISSPCASSSSSSFSSFFSSAAAAAPAMVMARRYASSSRRPTFVEISEALTVLGVSIDEEPREVKKKYRELVKKNHPDAGGDEATMARVTVAYERLSSLTNREREEFKMQRKMFHGSGGGGTQDGSRRYRPGPPGGFGYAAPNGPFHARAANMYGQYYQQDANTAYQQAHGGAQQGFWNQYHNRAGSSGFSDNPFNFNSPFSMGTQAQRVRFMPTGALLIRGLVVYLVLSSLFLFLYRRYRDWRQDDGWRMSESLARHEQMQEMHRIRQEMNERARAMLSRDGSGPGGELSTLAGPGGLYGSRQYVGESPEARALEYARQRRIQMMQEQQEAAAQAPELRGWPKIDDDKGRIIKRAQDPPGIVFFEPRREDTRRRQIENQRRASGFTRRAATAGEDGAAPAVVPPAVVEESGGASGQNGSRPLPPEANVGAVTMKAVGSEQEAQAVMRGIFGGLRRNSS